MVGFEEIQAAYYMVAATGVLVAAIYYVMNLRAQKINMKATLDTRQAQLLMQIYQRFSETDFMRKWVYTTYLMNYSDLDDFDQKYDPKENIDAMSQLASMFTYFEGIGVLVEEKLIDPRLVAKLISGNIIYFWEKFGPLIVERRKRLKNPYEWDKTEYLYNEMKKLRKDLALAEQFRPGA